MAPKVRSVGSHGLQEGPEWPSGLNPVDTSDFRYRGERHGGGVGSEQDVVRRQALMGEPRKAIQALITMLESEAAPQQALTAA
jgi:hypothetical protein